MGRRILLAVLMLAGMWKTAVAAPPCSADCNADGSVTVDELVRSVNIALGSVNVSQCVAADANLDSSITVDELVTGVNSALAGCPSFSGEYFGTVSLGGTNTATVLVDVASDG